MAKIELSVLSCQCMKDYFDSREELTAAVALCERERNQQQAGIDWRFTNADAHQTQKTLPHNLTGTGY
jgi:hypothetical protein